MAGLFGKIEGGQDAGEGGIRSFFFGDHGQQALGLIEIAKGRFLVTPVSRPQFHGRSIIPVVGVIPLNLRKKYR